ncbi:hypothetical protein BAQ46_23610 [Bacillus paranthracis]|nr:hypothetical protein ACS45_08730 [Bacillus cereus]OJE19817.1 hypothetical protein BAQ46_23610 [Bacillus paranthracis]OUA68155.1 hypothetical protein BK786_07810 [Bacillus thuringiensis serovar thailandensis]
MVITQLVFSHLDELTSDGYSNGTFTKKAVLRVGMLFDDNEIANKVMTQNIELCLIRKVFN